MTPDERATIDDISGHLSAAGIPHIKFDGACGELDQIEFSLKDDDTIRESLYWLDGHGWVLDSQVEPSPPTLATLPVADPANAFLVAAAVEGVWAGLIDEFRTISYGDRSYA